MKIIILKVNTNLSFGFIGWRAISSKLVGTDKQEFNADVGHFGVGICHDICFSKVATFLSR